jgi:tRNA1(Val) A37 N6-methylase TrmN6
VTVPEASVPQDHTVDTFLGGLVTLVQPAKGHRAGLDAALLQALVPVEASGHAIDLGAGVGTVPLSLAARAAGLTVIGVERDPTLVAYAREALERPENSAFADRIRIIEADVTERRQEREALGLPDASADWVLMNPPFDVEGRVRTSPDDRRRSAHVSDAGGLSAWCRTDAGLLKPGGTLCLIHRAQSLREVLEGLAGRFGEARITPVHPTAERAASRILVAARPGSRGGPQLMPGLVLHRADGSWTGVADAILRGRADLAS